MYCGIFICVYACSVCGLLIQCSPYPFSPGKPPVPNSAEQTQIPPTESKKTFKKLTLQIVYTV